MVQLNKTGKVTRAEVMLMIQMLSNSGMLLLNTIGFTFVKFPTQLFFGPLTGVFLLAFEEFIQYLCFSLLSSLIAMFCFRKQR
ncbi:unnamed protein product, partial [Mesorhabditis belari]|uniref:Uncharacterized protein n=1 Tax=Mesorhabditis belari TaxID=2138241 RepID=A0AAF3ERC6_9BILA